MSGGSLDYVYSKVEDAAERIPQDTITRIAFTQHLCMVAAALRSIEWNMSGDGDRDEDDNIRACFGASAMVDSALREAKRVRDELSNEIRLAERL